MGLLTAVYTAKRRPTEFTRKIGPLGLLWQIRVAAGHSTGRTPRRLARNST